MSLTGVVRHLVKSLTRPKARMLTPGEPAPQFQLRDSQGRELRLSDYQGKKVLLWFFPKAHTPG